VLAGALLASLGDPGLCHAGPWTQPRGGSYTKIALSYLYTRTEFDSQGNEVPLLTTNPLVRSAAYREVDLFGYMEYGIRDGWTLVGALPFKILTSQRTEISELADLVRNVDVTNAGLADLSIGVRRSLVRGRRPLSLEVVAQLPLGYDPTPDNDGPALGSGEPDIAASLLAGTNLRGLYATASAAYRVRGGPLANDIGFAAQVGGASGRLSGQALLEGWYSTVAPAPLDVSSTVAVTNQDVLKLILAAGWQTAPGAAVVVEAYHVIQGKNTATGTTVALALVIEN
jgi:hypothetical protein